MSDDIRNLIEVATGTVTGRDHTFGGNLVLGKGNQDAIETAWTKDSFIAVLCDGCSSGEHSEVGAQLICRLLLSDIVWLLEESITVPAQSPGVWSFGDCAVFQGGKVSHATFPGNAPPYLGYRLLPDSKVKIAPEELVFRPILTTGSDRLLLDDSCDATVRHIREPLRLMRSPSFSERQAVEAYFLCTATVVIVNESNLDMLPLVVGTDGLADVPDPAMFLEDRMFANPMNATRLLRKLNQPSVRIEVGDPLAQVKAALQIRLENRDLNVEQILNLVAKTPVSPPRLVKTDGVLPDDTTLVAIRKKPCGSPPPAENP